MGKQNLTTFFYLLLRDCLPSGIVEGLMIEVEKGKDHSIKYSNPHVEAHARELVERLLTSR
jgi:hypothetical protein